jgi:hypothetical protein
MSQTKRDYEIGYGKPPRERPFQKGQYGNPRGPRGKSLPARPAGALNEPIYGARSPSEPDSVRHDFGRTVGLGDPKRQRVDTSPCLPADLDDKMAMVSLRGGTGLHAPEPSFAAPIRCGPVECDAVIRSTDTPCCAIGNR